MTLPWWVPFGHVPEVEARELASRLGGSAAPQLLDVRTALEFRGGHIEGAVNAPILGLAEAIPTLGLDRARPVVAICATAHRSIPAVRLLRRNGIDALQLAGGMHAWRAAKLPERIR